MLSIQNMKIYYICTYLIFLDLRGWISPNNVQNQNLYISILFIFSLIATLFPTEHELLSAHLEKLPKSQ